MAAVTVPVAAPTIANATPVGDLARPAQRPAPSIATINRRLDVLARRAGTLAERFNAASIREQRAQRASAQASQAARSATRRLIEQRRLFAVFMNERYQQGPTASVAALLTSHNQGEYLQQLATADMVARLDAEQLNMTQSADRDARQAETRAARSLSNARVQRAQVQQSRRQVARQTAKYNALLNTLTAVQQNAYAARSAAGDGRVRSAGSVRAGSAAAQRAVDFALAQVGKPYVFGAAGPDSYDCSGLTMAAWKRGGVDLPHLASDQYTYGRRVGADELQPGDLVFLYEDLSHVSMYIGKGLLVSAPQPGENVKIVPFAYFRSDFMGGSRLA